MRRRQTRMHYRGIVLLLLLGPAAHAQFQLYSVASGVETPAPAVFSFGQVTSGAVDPVLFRLRNTSKSNATVYNIALAGQGFLLSNVPALPQTLNPQGSFDFTVQFQANAGGAYSAGMTLPGISIILTATVVPGLLYSATSPINFGPVVRGTTADIPVTISNRSTISVAIPSLTIHGTGFSLANAPPGGFVLNPQQSFPFDVLFSPAANGPYAGSLTAGTLSFTLAGAGIDPSLPKPILSIQLPQPGSGQQGSAIIGFDAVAQVGGTGVLTLDFQGPDDPGIAFSQGGRSASFTVSPGDSHGPAIPFQTGTTAGTLVLTVSLGAAADRQTVVIFPAGVSVADAHASRSGNALQVQVTGFDNTRTAGPLSFTFYDRAGGVIAPSPISASAGFADFFQSSGLGGLFRLDAAFPVTGDPRQVAAFEVQLTNAAGVATTGRIVF